MTHTELTATTMTRANGTCECCGETAGAQMLFRGTGGSDQNSWLWACDDCHNLAQTPGGLPLGWTVAAGNDPDLVPYFRRADSVWRRGGVPIPATDAVEYMHLVQQMKSGFEYAY